MAILDNPDTPSLIQLGMFEDITEQVKNWNLEEEYYSSILDTVKYEDRYYGLPLNCNSTALFYNKQMLKEAGVTPPSDWQELKEAAETYHKRQKWISYVWHRRRTGRISDSSMDFIGRRYRGGD